MQIGKIAVSAGVLISGALTEAMEPGLFKTCLKSAYILLLLAVASQLKRPDDNQVEHARPGL